MIPALPPLLLLPATILAPDPCSLLLSFSLLLPCSCSLPSFLSSCSQLFMSCSYFNFFYSFKSYSILNHFLSIVCPPSPTKTKNNNWEMKEDSSRTVCVAAFELMRNNVGWRKSFNAVSMWNDTEASVLRSAHSQQQFQLFLALSTIICTIDKTVSQDCSFLLNADGIIISAKKRWKVHISEDVAALAFGS
jgi:hypothetical protein